MVKASGGDDQVVWACPSNWWLAFSHDTAWDVTEGKSSIGWMLWDLKDALIAASRKVVQGLFDMLFINVPPTTLRLQGMGLTVLMPLVVGLNNVTVVRLLAKEEGVLALVKFVVEDILFMKAQRGRFSFATFDNLRIW